MATEAIVPAISASATSGRDPLDKICDIVKDAELTDTDKATLITYAQSRFKNRRRLAFFSLGAILVSTAVIFLAAFVDGICSTNILAKMQSVQPLLGAIFTFLAGIVGAYYGVSAWRPSS